MQQHTRAGFRHRDLVVYAVQNELATEPPSWVIVWLDGEGNSVYPWVRPAQAGKRMAAVRAGDVILHNGEAKAVAGVAVYRALGVEPGTEIVG